MNIYRTTLLKQHKDVFTASHVNCWSSLFSLLAMSLGHYGEQQGGGAHSGSDGQRRDTSGQVVRRMRRSNLRPLLAVLHGALLAHALPQVLLLPSSAGRVQQHLLQQRRDDPL